MPQIILELPDTLHQQLQALAEHQGSSLEHLVLSAVSEKVAMLSSSYLQQRAQAANVQAYAEALAAVPDVPAEEADAIPPDLRTWLEHKQRP